MDNLSQFFVRSEVVESSDTQVTATPRAKSNPFCRDSVFAESTTPLAMSTGLLVRSLCVLFLVMWFSTLDLHALWVLAGFHRLR